MAKISKRAETGNAESRNGKSLESWIGDAACSIRGAKDVPKYKDFILPLIFTKRLGLDDVEADIIGKSYEFLIRKFAEGGGQSVGEFYTPPEVGTIMSRVLAPEPGMEIYDPCCGSGGLLIKCEIAMEQVASPSLPAGEGAGVRGKSTSVIPLKLYGQEYIADTWAMANMNLIIHDFEGGDRDRRYLQEPEIPRQSRPAAHL